ncbi:MULTISPECIES: VWA domain-containing protein [unclassified Beijerinckia]|uniref:VWA domain-containing protein n=1 Tax=unclassified Beijerinckia TaxID=2638183 RepID=UPI00089636B6|nr:MULTISPECIES: VWA domain-containing protein [unclassified Beijerinckia]MDH7799856.1 Ca-activated chloride channel family protein [Beijerinckia sp. GAS462]SED39994.1 Ca-activated chloride channel family protein [Beijerinckia sp. 28-YEA-48]
MLTFAYPWLALLAPLPFAVWLLLPAHTSNRTGLRVPFFDRLVRLSGQQPHRGSVVTPRRPLPLIVLVVCWLLTLGALARPQWIEPPLHQDRPTRDLLLLVDLSGSMDTKDFIDTSGQTVDRLTAVKQVLDDFLSRRKGDRVGVVVFGDAPFVLVPFTTDLELCRALLRDTVVGMAGPRTAFGDAIGLGIGLFDKSTVKAKTIIALTDGNDTTSKVPPVEAAAVAKDRGIVIHTVAVGDPTAAGEDKLDEAALKQVASKTGGGFFRALDRNQLAGIYQRLDQIETRRIDTVSFRPKRDVYWMPLAAALVLSLLTQALRLLRGHRRTRPQADEAATATGAS